MNRNFKRKNNIQPKKNIKKFKEGQQLGRLEQQTYEYFSRIADVLKGNVDEDEMSIIATNALEQTEGIELDVCNHTGAASVLEALIPYASWDRLQKIIDSLNKSNKEDKGNCGSRVEEALIAEAGRRIRLSECPDKDDCLNYLNEKGQHLLNNIDDIWNLNANFSARRCISVSSGYEDKAEIISKSIVTNLSKKMMLWEELPDCYHQDIISGLLQILLFSLKAVSSKKCKKFARFLLLNCFMKDCENTSDLLLCEYFENVPWTRLLEAIIEVSSPELVEEIYQKLFSPQIDSLVLHKKGHFPVCKLIKSCEDKSLLEIILDKLKDKFKEILAANNLDVLQAFSEACLNTGEKQGDFIKSLTTALGCSGPNKEKYVIVCIISMTTCNEVNIENFMVNFHGSLILQNILKFKKPQKLVEALLSLNRTVLQRILSDPKGCFLTDAFMASSSIGVKSKDRLLQTLKGHFSELAMDKYGSRSFDVIWANANMKNRTLILSEMSRNIMKTQYGSIIASKTGLEMFLRDKHAWERAYNVTKTTNLFADIINPNDNKD